MTHAKSTDSRRQPAAVGPGPTMWARMAVQLANFAEKSGAQRDSLLADAGLARYDLADLDSRVPLQAVYRLIELAVERTGDQLFGLRFSQQFQFEDLDALGFLMATSPTLGHAFERSMRYYRLWNDGEHYGFYKDDDQVRITFTPHGPWRPAHRHAVEMAFYDIAVNSARLIGRAVPLRHVRFRHAALDPDDQLPGQSLDEFFGIEVEFRAPIDELIFPASILSIPLPESNPAMCQFFERYTREKLAVLPAPAPLRERARQWIAAHLHQPDLTLGELARQLKLSRRTLQRRLRDEGTSMNALLDEVRRERASVFLGSAMAIAEIAYMLGYSESSAFHRAFKRWTGQTPEAFREQGVGTV
ncbi:MAG: AraC family transcriptional regulator [Proteobacteria bacterium]|nr:AraC family transcriptional regulator [Pseudomonadota bacterium]